MQILLDLKGEASSSVKKLGDEIERPQGAVDDETRTFFENQELFNRTLECFQICTRDYHHSVTQKDYVQFPLKKAQSLLYLIEKTRFLLSNIDEEYRIYEQYTEHAIKRHKKGNETARLKIKLLLNGEDFSPRKNEIFSNAVEDLAEGTAELQDAPPRKVDELQNLQDPQENKCAETEEERINGFINRCLAKIIPKKTYVPNLLNSSEG